MFDMMLIVAIIGVFWGMIVIYGILHPEKIEQPSTVVSHADEDDYLRGQVLVDRELLAVVERQLQIAAEICRELKYEKPASSFTATAERITSLWIQRVS